MWIKYIKPFKIQAIVGFVFKMIEAFFELLVPLVVADIIDNGIHNQDQHYILTSGAILLGLAVVGYCCALVCQYYASKTSQGFGTYLRNDMYKAINAYDYQDLDAIGTPSLMTRLSNDVNQLQLAVAMAIRLVSRSPFLIIGSLIMAFRIDVQMAIIFMLCTPLLALTIYIVMVKSLPMYIKIQKQLDKVSLICRENLSGIRVIRAFSKQKQERKRFQDSTQQQKDMQIKVGKISALLNPSTSIIVNCAIIIILYVSGIKINGGNLSQGEVIALINYMNQILLSMFVFANVIVIFNKANASYKRVEEVLDIQPMILSQESIPLKQADTFIEFNNVCFSYQETHAMSDVSFSIEKGETVGVIGGTGSGKTTLVNLIARFYDIDSGMIKIYGNSIQNYPIKTLRQMIGLVPQQAVLFSGSIKENILWGNKKASDEEIKEALRIAQASSFVEELEKGIETRINQGGKNLSGGQKQRLTIARAVVKKPDILILDDSASALDFATDAALRKSLKSLHTTTLIVSQRVSSLMHADKILVLSHGELVGIGTHEDLMKNCDIYNEIATSQLSMEVA
ncbi:MAG: ABC transporter ATP-binding protein [Coprobacillus sp.]